MSDDEQDMSGFDEEAMIEGVYERCDYCGWWETFDDAGICDNCLTPRSDYV